jgi:DNA-binding NarL/FixJ family response regulator
VIRVLVVDDQHIVRAGLRALLDAEPDIEVVGEAADGSAVLGLARETRPDLVLMDVRMPGVDGLAATHALLGANLEPPPKVLVLTTFDLDEYVYEALAAGAGGFLVKHAPPAELTRAVRVVAAGDALIAPEVFRRLVADFVRSRPAPRPSVADLSPRETEVLVLIAEGLSNAEIAARLFLAEQTVKTHVGRIFTKVGLRDRAQAVVYAYRAGLVRA